MGERKSGPRLGPSKSSRNCRLVGDIGGTNARFAIVEAGVIGPMTVLPTKDFPTFEAAVRTYLATCPQQEQVGEAAFAIAGPVAGDRIAFTNLPWTFSIEGLRTALELDSLVVV